MDENLPIDVFHGFEDEIINIGTRTALKLLSFGSDELALYTFYCITAKRQSIALRKRVITVKASEDYCLKGLGWGQLRFRNTKKKLMEEKLVTNIIKKDEATQKITGYYIQINFVPIDQTQSLTKPVTGQTLSVDGDTPNTVIKHNDNNAIKDISINPLDVKEIKDIKNTDILMVDLLVGEPRQVTEAILIHFNTVYNTKYRAVEPILKSVEYWTKHYSLDEIKKAITNSIQDKWWVDKLTPTILFRKMNPNHEPVDYIGKFLNMAELGTFDATPLTPIQLWTIAKEREINLEDVQQKHKDVLSEAAKGSFPTKYKYETVEQAVCAWVDMGISKGSIKPCNELELMQLDNDHPDKVKEREYYFGLMREKGELE